MSLKEKQYICIAVNNTWNKLSDTKLLKKLFLTVQNLIPADCCKFCSVWLKWQVAFLFSNLEGSPKAVQLILTDVKMSESWNDYVIHI